METHPATGTFDDHARLVARSVVERGVPNSEAVHSILAEAVGRGVVSQQVSAAHGSAISRIRHDRDEFIGAATLMLTQYALPADKESPLDVSQFADGESSATGWVRRTVASFRPSRIERAIASLSGVAYLEDEVAFEPEAPSVQVREHVPDDALVAEASKDKRRGGETLLFIHASVLYELTGGPALRWWTLSDSERAQVLSAIEADPDLPIRSLRGADDSQDESDMVRELWSDWSAEQVEDVVSKSSSDRDIVALLTRAATTPLPRPPAGNRGREERILRRQVQDGLGQCPRDTSAALFDAFMAGKVATYCDKDRRRVPLDHDASIVKKIEASSFPMALSSASLSSGIPRDDILSALVRMTLAHVPALNHDHFSPTSWSFSSEKPPGYAVRRPLDRE